MTGHAGDVVHHGCDLGMRFSCFRVAIDALLHRTGVRIVAVGAVLRTICLRPFTCIIQMCAAAQDNLVIR